MPTGDGLGHLHARPRTSKQVEQVGQRVGQGRFASVPMTSRLRSCLRARASEICALEREQVTLGAHPTLRLHGKGRKERVVPLWKKTGSTLQVWFREIGATPHPYAFPNARGGMLTRHGLGYVLREAVQRAIPLCPSLAHKKASPHVVRHTTAVHLLQAGVDTSVIALWLGHESLETTHVYLETDLTTKEQALSKVDPLGPNARRFKPNDTLLSFLESL